MNAKKYFLDTNIFDELFRGGPASSDIAFILENIKRKKIIGYTSPKTLMDIYYLFHSELGWREANKKIKFIYSLVETSRQSSEEVKEAFALNWSDFEDAMQMTSAKNAEVDKLITLDKKFRNKDSEFIWTPYDLKSFIHNEFKK